MGGHSEEKCPQAWRAKKELRAAGQAARELRVAERQARVDQMVCFRCNLKGHARADCPWSAEEVLEMKRMERLSSTVCFRCGKQGHARADCFELASDASSDATAISEGRGSVSTVATATEALIEFDAQQKCKLCGVVQTKATKKG